MPKIKLSDLESISEKVKRTMLLREDAGRARVIVHMGTCGIAAGARPVMSAVMEEIEARIRFDLAKEEREEEKVPHAVSRQPIR